MKICKLLLAAAGATVLLGALVSTASAGRLEISETRISAMWRSVEFALPSVTVRCEVTLDATLHERTMIKDLGTLMGYITRAILGPCSNGTYTILTSTLPWHIRYSDFEGTLPEITSLIVHVIGFSWRISGGGNTCLARSSTTKPLIITFHRDPVTHLLTEAGLSGRIPTGIECFGIEGTFRSDSGSLSVSNSTTRVSVSLI
jgi:hypothetical protein